jgi:hypothetical protein
MDSLTQTEKIPAWGTAYEKKKHHRGVDLWRLPWLNCGCTVYAASAWAEAGSHARKL